MIERISIQGYLNVHLDRAAMARFGVPVAEVQEALETAVGGRPVSQMVEGNYSVDVAVQYPAALRGSAEAIGAITIPAARGARVPLAQIAQIRLEAGPMQVNREQAQRLAIVQANVRGRDLGGFAQEVRGALERGLQLPPGVFLNVWG